MFIIPSNIIRIQQELVDYKNLCKEFNYSPAKKEFDDIVNFILLNSGSDIGMFESSNYEKNSNYLYENFINSLQLLERGGSSSVEYTGEEGVEDLASLGFHTARKAAVGLAVGAGAAAVYIAYRFKKKKLDAALKKENDIEMKKLDIFKDISDLAIKIAKLKGTTPPKLTQLTQPNVEDKPNIPDRPDNATGSIKKTLNDIFSTSNQSKKSKNNYYDY